MSSYADRISASKGARSGSSPGLAFMKKADVDVRSEHIHVTKRRILDAGGRMAVVQELGNILAAVAHPGEPLTRNRCEPGAARFEPPVNPGVVSLGAIESEKAAGSLRGVVRRHLDSLRTETVETVHVPSDAQPWLSLPGRDAKFPRA
jgi:hypothetical protein